MVGLRPGLRSDRWPVRLRRARRLDRRHRHSHVGANRHAPQVQFDRVIEKRLEPGGLIVVNGQRLSARGHLPRTSSDKSAGETHAVDSPRLLRRRGRPQVPPHPVPRPRRRASAPTITAPTRRTGRRVACSIRAGCRGTSSRRRWRTGSATTSCVYQQEDADPSHDARQSVVGHRRHRPARRARSSSVVGTRTATCASYRRA